jgi:hypothetical protein
MDSIIIPSTLSQILLLNISIVVLELTTEKIASQTGLAVKVDDFKGTVPVVQAAIAKANLDVAEFRVKMVAKKVTMIYDVMFDVKAPGEVLVRSVGEWN